MLRLAAVLMAALLAALEPVRAQEGALLRGYERGGYQYVAFGAYPQGAQGEEAPVIWRVLESKDGVLYLMSDRILDVRRIDGDQWNYRGWESSELYFWLNGQMLETLFGPDEREALHEREGLGFVSLPSAEDIKNPHFGFATDESRRLVGTDYAMAQGLYRYDGRSYSPIWTRTPSRKKHAHRSTKSGGKIGFIGVESDDIGLTPVVWLQEGRVGIASGEGSLERPYALEVKEGNMP